MTAELLIARWMSLSFLIVGLSHLVCPAQWVALLRPLRDRDWCGLLLALFYLPQGLIVVLGHNVWLWGLPVIVTVIGWGMSFKGTLYLLFPRVPARMIASRMCRPQRFRIAGVLGIVLGAAAGYDAFLR